MLNRDDPRSCYCWALFALDFPAAGATNNGPSRDKGAVEMRSSRGKNGTELWIDNSAVCLIYFLYCANDGGPKW